MLTSSKRAKLLRDALNRVAESEGIDLNDPALVELRRVVLFRIIELEARGRLEAKTTVAESNELQIE